MTAVAVHHRLDGPEGAPVVVLSGSLGSTLEMWDAQVPALTERFRVLRYDHRGHGGSPVPGGPYSIGDLAGDVAALLDRLDIDRAHFCGLSLGGMVGMRFAAHQPERVDRLALCCTSAAMDRQAWVERAATVRAQGTAAVADAVVGRWFTPAYRERNREATARWRAMIAATPPEGYAGCCDAIATMVLEPLLARITAPTLVIAGAEDPATPPEHAERIGAAVPEAKVAVVAGGAHLANVEQADQVNRLLLAHLGEETL